MKLTSPAFQHNELIPVKYTCEGENLSPPLFIDEIPVGTHSMVLIMEDPDAPGGTWDHWIVWNILPTRLIAENKLPDLAVVGLNSWKQNSYGGPCPPSGTHRYFFKLYALKAGLRLGPSATKKDLEAAMAPSILGSAVYVGLYRKATNN